MQNLSSIYVVIFVPKIVIVLMNVVPCISIPIIHFEVKMILVKIILVCQMIQTWSLMMYLMIVIQSLSKIKIRILYLYRLKIIRKCEYICMVISTNYSQPFFFSNSVGSNTNIQVFNILNLILCKSYLD